MDLLRVACVAQFNRTLLDFTGPTPGCRSDGVTRRHRRVARRDTAERVKAPPPIGWRPLNLNDFFFFSYFTHVKQLSLPMPSLVPTWYSPVAVWDINWLRLFDRLDTWSSRCVKWFKHRPPGELQCGLWVPSSSPASSCWSEPINGGSRIQPTVSWIGKWVHETQADRTWNVLSLLSLRTINLGVGDTGYFAFYL